MGTLQLTREYASDGVFNVNILERLLSDSVPKLQSGGLTIAHPHSFPPAYHVAHSGMLMPIHC